MTASVPTLLLRRLPEFLDCTPGHIFFEGDLVCSTLELPWRDNQQNISCIPKGEYEIAITHSAKFKKKLIEILNVPDRTGIRGELRGHTANLVTQLQGCFAPCKYLVIEPNRVYAQLSTEAYERLEGLIVSHNIKKIVIT